MSSFVNFFAFSGVIRVEAISIENECTLVVLFLCEEFRSVWIDGALWRARCFSNMLANRCRGYLRCTMSRGAKIEAMRWISVGTGVNVKWPGRSVGVAWSCFIGVETEGVWHKSQTFETSPRFFIPAIICAYWYAVTWAMEPDVTRITTHSRVWPEVLIDKWL